MTTPTSIKPQPILTYPSSKTTSDWDLIENTCQSCIKGPLTCVATLFSPLAEVLSNCFQIEHTLTERFSPSFVKTSKGSRFFFNKDVYVEKDETGVTTLFNTVFQGTPQTKSPYDFAFPLQNGEIVVLKANGDFESYSSGILSKKGAFCPSKMGKNYICLGVNIFTQKPVYLAKTSP